MASVDTHKLNKIRKTKENISFQMIKQQISFDIKPGDHGRTETI